MLNAIQFSRERQTVEIRTKLLLPENAIEISVQDHGTGMDDDVKRRVFELFYTTRDEGTGLGLYSSRRCAQRNHWKLNLVASARDKGTTFSLLIPIKKEEDGSADREQPAHSRDRLL
jgi:two-component system sporulation sensor kinase A